MRRSNVTHLFRLVGEGKLSAHEASDILMREQQRRRRIEEVVHHVLSVLGVIIFLFALAFLATRCGPVSMYTRRDDTVTLARCPLCAGCGMVPPDVAATFYALCKEST
jgi:hypothetical protein